MFYCSNDVTFNKNTWRISSDVVLLSVQCWHRSLRWWMTSTMRRTQTCRPVLLEVTLRHTHRGHSCQRWYIFPYLYDRICPVRWRWCRHLVSGRVTDQLLQHQYRGQLSFSKVSNAVSTVSAVAFFQQLHQCLLFSALFGCILAWCVGCSYKMQKH